MQKQGFEEYFLSACLLNNSILDNTRLEPKYFEKTRNQLLFKTFQVLHKKNLKLDPIFIVKELGDQISNVGGTDYIKKISDCAPTAANVEAYETEILKEYRDREARRIMSDYLNHPDESQIEEISRELGSLVQNESREPSDEEVVREIIDELDQKKPGVLGVTTGSAPLDRMTGGLQDGDLTIVSARASVGKTAFTLNISRKAAESGVFVDFFSLEMIKKQIIKRILSSIGKIDMNKWKNPGWSMTEEEVQQLIIAAGKMMDMPIQFHQLFGPTVGQIRGEIEQSIRKHPGRHLAVIDYVKYIKAVEKRERYSLQIGDIAEDLKMTARALNLPIVLIAQINRGAEQRQDKRPMMSDLKDSGDLEQAADMIFLLYRDDYYNSDAESIIEINVAKNRNGPVGKVEMYFNKEHQAFYDLENKREAVSN